MKNKIVFSLIIFLILVIIPSLALSFFENKVTPLEATKKYTDFIESDRPKILSSNEDFDIKVYDLSTNSVITLKLEEYIKGVVAAEMPAEFELEALKAQAVTARTYTIFKIKRYPNGQEEHPEAPLCTGVHCQAYMSKEQLIDKYSEQWFNTYYAKISEAVESTRSQILTYQGKIIEPLFHSTSGGRTENSEDVFLTAAPYLRSVDSPYEGGSPKYTETVKMPVEEFISKLKSGLGNVDLTISNLKDKIALLEISEGGKVKSLQIDNKILTGRQIRALFHLNSTNFRFIQSDENIEIVTTGYGHGVGMSQYGANGMAIKGFTYKEILKHYYTGVEITLFQ